MKKKIIAIGVIIIVIGISFFFRADQPNIVTLKIGVISSLTGDYAAVGENTLKGIKVAQALYEQKTGKKIELIVEDDGADAKKGLAAYRKLSETNRVNGLINFFTTTMDSIYEPTKTAGYPVMMVAFQANNVGDDHVFQTTPGNDEVWPKYADYIKKSDYDLNNFVLVHSTDGAQESFATAFAKAYGDKATFYKVSSDKNNLRLDAAKIIGLQPTTLLLFMAPDNGALLTKELLPLLKPKTRLIYDVQLVTGLANYQKILGNLSKINGAITLSPEGEPDQEFIDAYHRLYNDEEPGFLADFGYDTFNIYMQTYDKDASKWIANLKKVDSKGASGQIKFNKDGIRLPDLVIKKVDNGKLVNIQRLPL